MRGRVVLIQAEADALSECKATLLHVRKGFALVKAFCTYRHGSNLTSLGEVSPDHCTLVPSHCVSPLRHLNTTAREDSTEVMSQDL